MITDLQTQELMALIGLIIIPISIGIFIYLINIIFDEYTEDYI